MQSRRTTDFLYYPALAVLLLAQLPFWVLCFYTHPLGIHEWDWIANWAGDTELAHVHGFWDMQKYWYMTTMGRYSSTFILGWTPYWFTFPRFQWVFVLNLLLLNGAVYYLLRGWFAAWGRKFSWLVTLLILALYLFQLNNVYENIYNYMVVTIYHSGTIAAMLLFGLLARAFRKEDVGYVSLGLMGPLALFVPGTNELSLLSTGLILGGIVFLRVLKGQGLPVWYWMVCGIFMIGALIAILAPGNYVRMETYPGGQHRVMYYVALAAGVVVYQFAEWLATSLLLPAVALWLVFFKMPAGMDFRNSWISILAWPVGFVLLVFGFLWMYLRATGGISLPERLVDNLYFIGILMMLGLLGSLFSERRTEVSMVSLVSLSAFIGLHLFFAGLSLDRDDPYGDISRFSRVNLNSNIGNAGLCLIRGDASRYDAEMRNAYVVLQSCDQDTCYLPSLSREPFGIYDPLFDRRTKRGEPFMGWYFQQRSMLVRYQLD